MPRASTTAGILFGHRNVAWTGALREAADADIPPRLRGPDWTGTGERWSDVVDRVRSELAHTLALGDDTVWVAHSGTMDAAMEALQVPAVPAELNPGFLWMMVFDLKYLSAESGRATPQTVINYFGPSWCGLKYLRRGC